MPCIVFYEKPGCATNRLQKQLLRSAGLKLEVRNLLSESWTHEHLRRFFGELPVAEWFNRSAPAIKYGELDPTSLSQQQALDLMVAQPLLIRRPLIHYGTHYMAGFDLARLNAELPFHDELPEPSVAFDSCSATTPTGCRSAGVQ